MVEQADDILRHFWPVCGWLMAVSNAASGVADRLLRDLFAGQSSLQP